MDYVFSEELQITQKVMDEIAATVGLSTPETGGILGAGDDGIISNYYFDKTGKSSADGYAPDVKAINEVLTNEWMPNGILMVGIVHSHANSNITPSCGDISYGIRILQALDTVDRFYLPIVTNKEQEITMNVYVVMRDTVHGFICKSVDYNVE